MLRGSATVAHAAVALRAGRLATGRPSPVKPVHDEYSTSPCLISLVPVDALRKPML